MVGDLRTECGPIAGRYVVENELARGGMGVVFRVVDRSTGSVLALKRSLDSGATSTALFEREYRTLVALRHPRIVRVFDYGVTEGGAFYTMELLDGSDLRARSPLDWREVCANLREIASSLALLHSRRLLHRDVSPANIRLTREGRAKLIDFGTLTSFGKCTNVAGTPSCVAPEAVEGLDLDQRVDLYALGATAYHALTGKNAYPARTFAEARRAWARGAPLPPSRLVSSIPPGLDELVLALLSLDRTLRPENAAEVIDRLGAIAGLPPEQDARVANSYLVSQELLGRDRQFARLRSRLSRSRSGNGSAVLVEGPAGHGRSALLRRFESEGRVEGTTVLAVSGRAHQRAFRTCFALVQRAMDELSERALPLVRMHLPQLDPSMRGASPTDAAVRSLPSEAIPRGTAAALQRFFVALAATDTVVLLIDDAHVADGPSLSVLGSLAKIAGAHRLLIVATVDTSDAGRDRAGIKLLERSSAHLRLRPFTPGYVEELVQTLFGEVSATRRVAAWLHQQTGGNPSLCTALIAHLVEQGRIHYAEGTWVLPHEFPEEDVPGIVAEAMQSQLSRLRPELRSLAACLSPHRRPLDDALCGALRGVVPELVTSNLGELLRDLVREGILVGDSGEYVFARPKMRELLYASLEDSLRQRLHRRAAAKLLEAASGDPEYEFEAGRHLLLAGDRRQATRRIGRCLVQITSHPDSLVRAVPQLKDLHKEYRRIGSTDNEVLPIVTSLVIAGYYVDPTVHDEHGNETAELLQRKSGFALAARLVPYLGSHISLLVGAAWGLLQFAWSWRDLEGQRADSFMLAFVGVCAARSAVAYLRFEQGVHEFVLKLLMPAKGLHEHNALRLVYDLMALTMAESRGELGKRQEGYEDQFARLRHVKMLDESRQHYESGLLCSRGHLLLFCTGTGPLECADRVDAMGGQHARVVAQSLRTSYYRFRGENGKANQEEAVLDAMAAQYGHRWVPDVLAIWDLVPYHLAGDVVGLKRVLHRTERILSLAPAFALYRDILRAMYEGHRGRPAVALSIYEGLRDRLVPFTSPVWSFASAHRAECLNTLGRYAEALAECDQALCHIGQLTRSFVIAYQQLEREAATAMAHLGRTDEAARKLDDLLARHADDSHPLLLGLLNRDRARIALLANDRPAFERHAARTTALFSSTGSATLIAQAHRLARLIPPSPETGGTLSPPWRDQEVTLPEALADAPLDAVAERALEHIVKLSGASRAYLYLLDNGAVVLAARHGDAPVTPLETQVQRLLDSLTEGCNLVTRTAEATPSSPSECTLLPLVVEKEGEVRPVGAAVLFDPGDVHRLTSRHLARLAAALQARAATVRVRTPLHRAGDSPR